MDLASGYRMGTGMGKLEKRRWILRLGTYGTWNEHQRQYQHPFIVVGIRSAKKHLLRQLPALLLTQKYGDHPQHDNHQQYLCEEQKLLLYRPKG